MATKRTTVAQEARDLASSLAPFLDPEAIVAAVLLMKGGVGGTDAPAVLRALGLPLFDDPDVTYPVSRERALLALQALQTAAAALTTGHRDYWDDLHDAENAWRGQQRRDVQTFEQIEDLHRIWHEGSRAIAVAGLAELIAERWSRLKVDARELLEQTSPPGARGRARKGARWLFEELTHQGIGIDRTSARQALKDALANKDRKHRARK